MWFCGADSVAHSCVRQVGTQLSPHRPRMPQGPSQVSMPDTQRAPLQARNDISHLHLQQGQLPRAQPNSEVRGRHWSKPS